MEFASCNTLFKLMFLASRDLGLESFLHASVQKAITNHVLVKTVLDERGENLANAGCKCNWLKVLEVGGVVCSLGLRDQLKDSPSLSLRNLPHL